MKSHIEGIKLSDLKSRVLITGDLEYNCSLVVNRISKLRKSSNKVDHYY